MAKVSRATAALQHKRTPPSINTQYERFLEQSLTTTRPLGRRASRSSLRGPQIVVAPPQSEESLYPSLTTLASLDDEEDEFSCKDCCRSGL